MIKINSIISNGLAYGKAIHIENGNNKYDVYSSDKNLEISLFDMAISKSLEELNDAEVHLSDSDKEFVMVHKMLISDPQLRDEVLMGINEERYTAVSSFVRVVDKYIETFKSARTTYLSERALDMEDVKRRVLANLSSKEKVNIDGEFILVVDELYPSYLMTYGDKVLGVIALKGGFTSHSAILCKSREIPYVLVDDISDIVGDVMIDTRRELVIKNPSSTQINEYNNSRYDKEKFEINDFSSFGVSILANVSSNNDIAKVLKYNMDGIGLYRTELIFMNLDKAMSYEDQYNIYKDASSLLDGKPITFRTFDIGDDKQLSYIKSYHKGIDNYKNNPEIFETQIKALISANVSNNIRIMFPMIETPEEFNYLKDWTLKIKDDLGNKSNIKIGMMLETKKAVELLDEFNGVDFMSLGTNDLTKELYKISREEAVNYKGYINDLLNVLERIVNICNKSNIELSICGELAAIKPVARRLYRTGIRKFSVSVSGVKTLNDALMAEIEE